MKDETFKAVKAVAEELTRFNCATKMIEHLLKDNREFQDIVKGIRGYIDLNFSTRYEKEVGIPSTAYPDLRHDFVVHLTRYALRTHWPLLACYLKEIYSDQPDQKRTFSDPQPIPCQPIPEVSKEGIITYRPAGEVHKDVAKNNADLEAAQPKAIRERAMAKALMGNTNFMAKLNRALDNKDPSHVLQKIIRDSEICDDWCKTFTVSILAWMHVLLEYPLNWRYLHLPTNDCCITKEKGNIVAKLPFMQVQLLIYGSVLDTTDPQAVLAVVAAKESEIKQMKQTTAQPQLIKDSIAKSEKELSDLLAYLDIKAAPK